jgi:hypothetical protein
MEAFIFSNYYYFTIFSFVFFVLWRVFNLSFLIVQLIYSSEGRNWNSEINPFKLIFSLILLIIFFVFLYPIYKSLSNPINLFEQAGYFIVLLLIYGSIEYVIQNPTKKYMTEEELIKSKKFDKIHIKNMYDKGIENGLIDCKIEDLKRMCLGLEPINKILFIRKAIRNKNKKDRKAVANFINECTKGKFENLHKEYAIDFINRYIDFNEKNHPEENPYNDKNWDDWKNDLDLKVI